MWVHGTHLSSPEHQHSCCKMSAAMPPPLLHVLHAPSFFSDITLHMSAARQPLPELVVAGDATTCVRMQRLDMVRLEVIMWHRDKGDGQVALQKQC